MDDGRGVEEVNKKAARPQVAGEGQQNTPVPEPLFYGIAWLGQPQGKTAIDLRGIILAEENKTPDGILDRFLKTISSTPSGGY